MTAIGIAVPGGAIKELVLLKCLITRYVHTTLPADNGFNIAGGFGESVLCALAIQSSYQPDSNPDGKTKNDESKDGHGRIIRARCQGCEV